MIETVAGAIVLYSPTVAVNTFTVPPAGGGGGHAAVATAQLNGNGPNTYTFLVTVTDTAGNSATPMSTVSYAGRKHAWEVPRGQPAIWLPFISSR